MTKELVRIFLVQTKTNIRHNGLCLALGEDKIADNCGILESDKDDSTITRTDTSIHTTSYSRKLYISYSAVGNINLTTKNLQCMIVYVII